MTTRNTRMLLMAATVACAISAIGATNGHARAKSGKTAPLFTRPEAVGNSKAAPTYDELKGIDTALETVRTVCAEVLRVIQAELQAQYPGISARRSHGVSKLNDYRNYQWISVKIEEREYLVTIHHDNLDLKTGNPHTQYGRVQFWKCAGPNGPHTKDENGVWRFRYDNEWDKMPTIFVWGEDYSSKNVAKLFGEFLKDMGEDKFLGECAAKRNGAEEPAIADVPLEERQKVDAALASIRPVASRAMASLFRELQMRHPDWKMRRSYGNSRKNDYRNYLWITITTGEGDAARMYIVCFHYSDIDRNTGNTHTQYGRIQFWRDIHYEMGPKVEAGPHTKDGGHWRFRDDKIWKDMPRIYLWDDDYSTEHVADLFDQFVRECGEQ